MDVSSSSVTRQVSAAQLSAASTEHRLNWAPRQLGAGFCRPNLFNSAPHQLSRCKKIHFFGDAFNFHWS